jgi:hypothetical protein
MSQKYTVAENETLSQIAFAQGFHPDTLLKANEKKWPFLDVIANMLTPGMVLEIPDKKTKKIAQNSGTSAAYTVKKPPKTYLSLSVRDAGFEIVSVELTLNGSKTPIKEIWQPPYRIIETKDPLPDKKISDASLKIKRKSMLTDKEQEQTIKLHVGGFDAIIDPSGKLSQPSSHVNTKKAVQKVLTNLGYYQGKIDGDLKGPDTKNAIARFQTEHMDPEDFQDDYGVANHKTCTVLMLESGNPIGILQPIKKT